MKPYSSAADNTTELAAQAALLYNYFASIVAGVATAHRAAISASTLATKSLVIALALYRAAQRVAKRARLKNETALPATVTVSALPERVPTLRESAAADAAPTESSSVEFAVVPPHAAASPASAAAEGEGAAAHMT